MLLCRATCKEFKMNEIWLNYDNTDYSVSDLGRIRNDITCKILKPFDSGRGYLRVILYRAGKATTETLHRLIAKTFISNPNCLETVNHKDGNKLNNTAENLEWCTIGDNLIHALDTGLRKTGEEHHFAELNDSDVLEIVEQLKGGLSRKALAKAFDISPEAIRDIEIGKTWGRLTGIQYNPKKAVLKLSGEDIPHIRALIASGDKDGNIGKLFGVCAGTINGIRHGKFWKNY